MIRKFLRRLFKGRDDTPALPVSDMPSGEDYANEICRWVFRENGCRMLMGNIDKKGNLRITDGREEIAVIPPDKIPRNDPGIY